MFDLYSFLGLTKGEIKEIISNIDGHYKWGKTPKIKFGTFQLDKQGKIKYRYLHTPYVGLMDIQKKIIKLLEGRVIFPENMYGSIPKRNHIMNAKQHLNKQFFFTIDLKNFFTNINHQQVFKALLQVNFTPQEARVISKLVTYRRSLPQGAPSSPIIANLVFSETIKQLNYAISSKEIVFTNYLDDLCFSSNRSFKGITSSLLNIITNNEFYPSPGKIHYQIGKSEITGLVVKRNRIAVTPEMKRRAKENDQSQAYVKMIESHNQNYKLPYSKERRKD